MFTSTQSMNPKQMIVGLRLLIIAPAIWMVAGGLAPAESVDGFLEPYRRIDLASPETGVVTGVLVEEGSVVKAGQVLATLDDQIYVAALAVARHEAESKAQLITAQAQLKMRKTRLDKLLQLYQAGNAQFEEVERARTDLAVAEAAVLSAEEYLEAKKLECEKIKAQILRRKIVSPIDGCVTAIHKREGEVVSPADPKVLVLTKLDVLSATFLLKMEQARRFQKGRDATINVLDEKTPMSGVVEYVSPVADAESGTVEVRVRVPNADGRLLGGQRCSMVVP